MLKTFTFKTKTTFQSIVDDLREVNQFINAIENKNFLNKGDFKKWEYAKINRSKLYEQLEQFNLKGFLVPNHDHSGKVALMKYCNNQMSYAVAESNETLVYFLCSSPVMSNIILDIISEHNSFEEMQKAFYNNKF